MAHKQSTKGLRVYFNLSGLNLALSLLNFHKPLSVLLVRTLFNFAGARSFEITRSSSLSRILYNFVRQKTLYVTGFAKRGLIHASDFAILKRHNFICQ